MPSIISARLRKRLLLPLAAVVLLSACSAIGLAYRQSTTALYWWLDAQLDLNDRQTALLRKELDAIYAWHRRAELPGVLAMLERWEGLSSQALNAQQVCAEFDQARSATERLTAKGMPALARLGRTLDTTQVAHLAKHQAEKRTEFADENMDGASPERFEKRLEKLQGRYEDLFGSLSDAQMGMLQEGLKGSPFSGERSLRERERRDQDLRDTLLRIQQLPPQATGSVADPAAQAERWMKEWHERAWHSPTPGYQAYGKAITEHGCKLFAKVLGNASPEQRQHAAEVLKGYRLALSDAALPGTQASGANASLALPQ